MSAEAERLLKVSVAAERLSVGIDWVYERIKRGELPVVELGDTRKNQRIRESDLQRFISDRTYGDSAAPSAA
ncbi:helix-turn-helix domain-containing protein [Microbacterium sp. LWO14-1.2]|uniref:helix-turn-helix transcriptional regulator n=1 Tax=Microbacterium sp. LWO14-1.2 TaxID=3135263 RepID=UPI0031386DDF